MKPLATKPQTQKKNIILLIPALIICQMTIAQMDVPPSGGNARAKITEETGITDITIKYSRPDVAGRDGKIWGDLISYGFSGTNFITNKNNSHCQAIPQNANHRYLLSHSFPQVLHHAQS